MTLNLKTHPNYLYKPIKLLIVTVVSSSSVFSMVINSELNLRTTSWRMKAPTSVPTLAWRMATSMQCSMIILAGITAVS